MATTCVNINNRKERNKKMSEIRTFYLNPQIHTRIGKDEEISQALEFEFAKELEKKTLSKETKISVYSSQFKKLFQPILGVHMHLKERIFPHSDGIIFKYELLPIEPKTKTSINYSTDLEEALKKAKLELVNSNGEKYSNISYENNFLIMCENKIFLFKNNKAELDMEDVQKDLQLILQSI